MVSPNLEGVDLLEGGRDAVGHGGHVVGLHALVVDLRQRHDQVPPLALVRDVRHWTKHLLNGGKVCSERQNLLLKMCVTRPET